MTRTAHQISLPFDDCPVTRSVAELSSATADARGAIFTRREVVDFILDLVGYTADKPLADFRLLEPSFGHGDFLLRATERLLDAYRGSRPLDDLAASIRAVEIHRDSAEKVRAALIGLICDRGYAMAIAQTLAEQWLIVGDFLLTDLPSSFTHVVGNPPYVRQEAISPPLLAEYRARYATVYDRADLYVPFFEHALELLQQGGALGFICSDRWMKNKYGGPLRKMIADDFHLACYVDMVDTAAFHSEVVAYPAITVIARERGVVTRIAHRPQIDCEYLRELAGSLRGEGATRCKIEAEEIVRGDAPWILHSPERAALVRRLEERFPLLEATGCQVGIGVATGADAVFIADFEQLDVEPDRKLRLATTRDIAGGSVSWHGKGVVNPFADDGSLVDLKQYPRLANYLGRHTDVIRKRNVAQRNPNAWFRTIDRIYPELAARPKLLIPDIKGEAHIVLENGYLYPHHNLYYIVSDEWDLDALRAVLRSGIATLFVATYSVQMRGGHLRFQAQYLRRIRLPHWHDVDFALKETLIAAARNGDDEACREIVFNLYGLDQSDRLLLNSDSER